MLNPLVNLIQNCCSTTFIHCSFNQSIHPSITITSLRELVFSSKSCWVRNYNCSDYK